MTNHWVGHSKMKPIDFDEFFDKKVIFSIPGSLYTTRVAP